jgi:hypothetical protein
MKRSSIRTTNGCQGSEIAEPLYPGIEGKAQFMGNLKLKNTL